jgi:hypothetical protein
VRGGAYCVWMWGREILAGASGREDPGDPEAAYDEWDREHFPGAPDDE